MALGPLDEEIHDLAAQIGDVYRRGDALIEKPTKPEPVESSDEPSALVSIEGIQANILAELNRRLGDPELAKDIPGTGLVALAKELLKGQQQRDRDKADPTTMSDILDTDGIPNEMRLELLYNERDSLRGQLDKVQMLIEEIVG